MFLPGLSSSHWSSSIVQAVPNLYKTCLFNKIEKYTTIFSKSSFNCTFVHSKLKTPKEISTKWIIVSIQKGEGMRCYIRGHHWFPRVVDVVICIIINNFT